MLKLHSLSIITSKGNYVFFRSNSFIRILRYVLTLLDSIASVRSKITNRDRPAIGSASTVHFLVRVKNNTDRLPYVVDRQSKIKRKRGTRDEDKACVMLWPLLSGLVSIIFKVDAVRDPCGIPARSCTGILQWRGGASMREHSSCKGHWPIDRNYANASVP